MGSVGLSFGSPTSGAGFDVSSTVAEIVSNLRNVETPWNTQLTTLHTQDTAISSLGTLYSNLSNDMSSLTDLQGIMATKTGSSSDTNVLTLTAADNTAVAGTHTVEVTNLAQTSSGYMALITSSSDTLSGSITLQAGSGTAQTITLGSTNNTLSGLASAINSSGAGVVASVLTDSSGSRLSLVSGTSGAGGTITVSNNTIADVTTSSGTLAYTSAVTGKDAQLTVDGVALTSSSNTVANLIPGITFQLLAPTAAGAQVQVVIGNDNSGVESTINQMVSDYNSLVSAINAQEGNDSSGNAEPLYGSPTLSLLQQQLMSGLNMQNPNGSLDAISNASDTLSGSINISLAGGLPLYYSGAAGTDTQPSTGTLDPIVNTSDTLSGSITIQVGSGTAQTVTLDSSDNTLTGLMNAINNTTGIGVTASVVTNSDGSSSLSLLSGTSGTAGTLTVTSSIVDTSPQTIAVPTSSGNNNLSGLASAINSSHAGVTASVVTNSTGSQLVLVSHTTGSAGALTVTPSITDTTTSTAINYNSGGSDINSLTGLGISVNNDGSLSFDAASLDSVLNSDYSGVVGFFQNANSWGQRFSATVTGSGTSSVTGVLALAAKSNSSIESSLNADISKEESLISAQQKSLTTELNTANQVMQSIPSLLTQVNELYSAITGYNQNVNG
ncbi:MAG: flagellar filament capping protein FliD [Terracidiphilus sp.]|jgi:flagellar hook-associated protein 2